MEWSWVQVENIFSLPQNHYFYRFYLHWIFSQCYFYQLFLKNQQVLRIIKIIAGFWNRLQKLRYWSYLKTWFETDWPRLRIAITNYRKRIFCNVLIDFSRHEDKEVEFFLIQIKFTEIQNTLFDDFTPAWQGFHSFPVLKFWKTRIVSFKQSVAFW